MVRYIDADKMREDWLKNGENEYVYDTNAVIDSIDDQPTADVVEVKHGEWIEKTNTYNYSDEDFEFLECSVCGSCCPIQYSPPYCPDCGAKMNQL